MPYLALLLPDERVISDNIFDIIYGENTYQNMSCCSVNLLDFAREKCKSAPVRVLTWPEKLQK